jgi:hypothetical protein
MLLRRRELAAQDLDRDQPVQGHVAREEHHAHAAASELAHDLIVRPELLGDLGPIDVRRAPSLARLFGGREACVDFDGQFGEVVQGNHGAPAKKCCVECVSTIASRDKTTEMRQPLLRESPCRRAASCMSLA